MRAAALLLAATSAYAAIDGDPVAPYPGHPKGWLDMTNDGVLNFGTHDDGLTFQMRGGLVTPALAIGAAFSAGTDVVRGLRRDELTLVVGMPVLDGAILLCPGLRLTGDLGGGYIQRRFHGATSQYTAPMSYEGHGVRTDPVLVTVVALPMALTPRVVASWSLDWCDTDTGASWEARPWLRFDAGWVTVSGDHHGSVDNNIAAQRRGWHYGFSMRAERVSWGIEFGAHESLGRLGVSF